MSTSELKPSKTRRNPLPDESWTDEELIRSCLEGENRAWDILVERYKHLVFSIALKYTTVPENTADLFQAIWLDVFHDLSNLKKRSSFSSWLISLARNKCYHWKKAQRPELSLDSTEANADDLLEATPRPVPVLERLEQLEHEQRIRSAIGRLPARCRELIRLLFFSFPPRPYREVAARLGLALGSVAFIRARCLDRLKRLLER